MAAEHPIQNVKVVFKERIAEYEHTTPGEAQFWSTHASPGIHAILPEMGWEFSNRQYIGRDPTGVFCYDKFSQIPKRGQSNFKVETIEHDEEVYVNIKFYAANGSDVFGEFFALDHGGTAQHAGIVGVVGDGRWTEVDAASAVAHVRKAEGESTVTLTCEPAEWTAVFDTADDEELKRHEVDVAGQLRFKDLEEIQNGVWVRWDFDHLIFYRSDLISRASDYTAYFMSHEEPDVGDMGPLWDVDKVFKDVEWTYTGPPARDAA